MLYISKQRKEKHEKKSQWNWEESELEKERKWDEMKIEKVFHVDQPLNFVITNITIGKEVTSASLKNMSANNLQE